MSRVLGIIKNTPTNLIMGFLGSGKTTTILHLFSQKPVDEKWAVLVNEFGAIGIDGTIYAAQGIEVKEVAGGCMCCVAGVSMQVAINTLLKEVRPDRLLIEPTGLGHPRKVIDTLKGEGFRTSLDLKASICLLDPMKLHDSRYTNHENFVDQIAMSDILVANKVDQADAESLRLFDELAVSSNPSKQQVIKTQFGRLDSACLDLIANTERKATYANHHDQLLEKPQDGFESLGWCYEDDIVFSFEQLKSLFEDEAFERVKAVMQTDKGWFIFNAQSGQLSVISAEITDELVESRVEIIHPTLEQQYIETSLKHCKLR